MPLVIGVVFKKDDSISYFDPQDIKLEAGDKVVCHYEDATEIGEIVEGPVELVKDDITTPLTKIIRKATPYDISVEEINKNKEAEGVKEFDDLTKKHKLPMKLVDVKVLFDKSKMIFYFTAEKRVDFRELVKELASHFKIRIELRQIGVRDEAKIVGGLGPCGLRLCCKSFLTDFESISIKMAKDQNLPLNPLKISGICGRLMCCLRYEYDNYKDFVALAPERGSQIRCSHGCGMICAIEPLKETVVVELENETRVSLTLSDIEVIRGPVEGESDKKEE